MNRIVIVGMLLLQLVSFGATAQEKDDIFGYWLDEKQETVIRIYEGNDLLFGEIVWLRDSLDLFGQELRDVLNDDTELRPRKVLGTNMLEGFVWDGEGTWRKGDIYYYQSGNDYNGKIYVEDGKLKLRGYYSFFFFLGRTKTWERVQNPEFYGLE